SYRIERFECTYECAGRKDVDSDASAGRIAHSLCQLNCAVVKAGQTFRPVGDHPQLPDALSEGRRREAYARAGSKRSGTAQYIPTSHAAASFCDGDPRSKTIQLAQCRRFHSTTERGLSQQSVLIHASLKSTHNGAVRCQWTQGTHQAQ